MTTRFSDHINGQKASQIYQDEYFSIKYFQKGTGHLTFKRPELIDKMNDIITKHYLGMLPSR
ncbi:DUF4942 domain-containing protein [Enterobacteriaceae bacterium ML5]|nr:DUF4942 domain-containing protein [Enterobacteriaceae bacterium ML5]